MARANTKSRNFIKVSNCAIRNFLAYCKSANYKASKGEAKYKVLNIQIQDGKMRFFTLTIYNNEGKTWYYLTNTLTPKTAERVIETLKEYNIKIQ